jgi:uncharacterized repeat protein (TIGR01451 family)
MKRRNLGARLAVISTCICMLGALTSALGVAPVAADTTPPPCHCALTFTIEKFQEIVGSKQGPTKSKLIGAVGQTVDYEIVVTNTAHMPETFSEFSDAHCDSGTLAGGPGTSEVLPGHSTVWTCSRHLTAPGTFTNEATVTGSSQFGGVPLTQTSNRVVVEVPAPPPPPPTPSPQPTPAPTPAFTIEKRQEIAGSKAGFTVAPLHGTVGETVDYEIVVTNTGPVALKFSSFSDALCDQPTIAGGPGEGAVAPGTATIFTCSHLLSSAGTFVNTASVIGTAPGAAPLSETSNPVEVMVPTVVVKCFQAVQPVYHLPTGPKRSPFSVQISSLGAQQITVYLDGHKLKTFKQSQARGGKFTIKLNPHKLHFGPHTLAIRGISSDPECVKIAAASSFVHPRPPIVHVKSFTG